MPEDLATVPPSSGPVPSRLFGGLPPDIFRLFSGTARWFYADLLELLDRELFGLGAGSMRQSVVIQTIAEFIDRQGRAAVVEEDIRAIGGASPPGTGGAGSAAYARLVGTGWLVEHRDRYRRTVDMDGGARLLLELLLDMKRGRTRSYGGEVLTVLTALTTARERPSDLSENVRNAARSSRAFLNHLRSVASALRGVEQAIARQTDLSSMFRSFFQDFVTEHLVEDFKRLHTGSNPFRFRADILETAEAMLADRGLLEDLADGYCREGRARDVPDGLATVDAELREVLRVFGAIDEHLDLIEEIGRSMERRLRNTVRHLDRVATADTGAVAQALAVLGRVAADAIPPGPLPLLRPSVALGPGHLFQSARRRLPPARRPIHDPAPDPAFVAYQRALQEFRGRMNPTPARIREYLAAALGDRSAIPIEDLPLRSLDDFVVLERLPHLVMSEDGLGRDFRVTPVPGPRFESEWINCARFVVSRVARGEVADA